MTETKSKKTEDKKTNAPADKDQYEGLSEKQIKALERAEKARARKRASLSKIDARGLRKNNRTELRKIHCPESFGKYEKRMVNGRAVSVMVEKPEVEAFFTDSSEQTFNRKIDEGCRPVYFDGTQVMDGNDVMWVRDYDFVEHEHKAFGKESVARLDASKAKAAATESKVSFENATVEKGMGN